MDSTEEAKQGLFRPMHARCRQKTIVNRNVTT